jgi:hypothetical protein
MHQAKRTLFQILLGTLTCVLVVALSSPAWSRVSPVAQVQNQNGMDLAQAIAPTAPDPIQQYLAADLQAAESAVLAQGMPSDSKQRYVAIMSANSVVPNVPTTEAIGVAGAVLVGDRLVVRGDFGNLSSLFRDYATDPANPPNPNITSAVHIHRGEPGKNGPFQYALSVMLDASGLGGRLMGEYTLTPEQLQALSAGNLYMDMHTQKNRTGELRGAFRPVSG